ncbi:hypothetical protein T265_12122 [Opisthorchis viverrini]|uniref:Uncharacterized protein n=1 Tax=Opisthorchis viverrini TaxID=6198 RepID=A0A074ZUJ2_OPIVI|nr:hypothetical protein T265_12122 [Opisthorchis viverrini]KER18869.1 hypothetical protein T265_12122 [Opisthorchis viverrini]
MAVEQQAKSGCLLGRLHRSSQMMLCDFAEIDPFEVQVRLTRTTAEKLAKLSISSLWTPAANAAAANSTLGMVTVFNGATLDFPKIER